MDLFTQLINLFLFLLMFLTLAVVILVVVLPRRSLFLSSDGKKLDEILSLLQNQQQQITILSSEVGVNVVCYSVVDAHDYVIFDLYIECL